MMHRLPLLLLLLLLTRDHQAVQQTIIESQVVHPFIHDPIHMMMKMEM